MEKLVDMNHTLHDLQCMRAHYFLQHPMSPQQSTVLADNAVQDTGLPVYDVR